MAFNLSERGLTAEIMISTEAISRMGMMALSMGMSGSSMGMDAISEIKRVDTSSETSSSPSCLLPVILSEKDRSIYKITVLMTIDNKKITPFY